MVVVSATSFSANKAKYLDLARGGETVVLQSRSHGSFELKPVEEDANTVTPALRRKMARARKLMREGKCVTLRSHEDIDKYFDSI